jgi:hypothetical protein
MIRTNEEITRDLLIREIRRLEAELEQRTRHYQKLQERHDGLVLDIQQLRAEVVVLKSENARLKVRRPLVVGPEPERPVLVRLSHKTEPPSDDGTICGERSTHQEFWGDIS